KGLTDSVRLSAKRFGHRHRILQVLRKSPSVECVRSNIRFSRFSFILPSEFALAPRSYYLTSLVHFGSQS
ncbi:hypothetical protein A2U01_0010741, partial [Trifolium medium]|nr:hypothetical protein [Trifolium medium]